MKNVFFILFGVNFKGPIYIISSFRCMNKESLLYNNTFIVIY